MKMGRARRIIVWSRRGARDQAGYSLIEMTIATAIMLVVTGAIFGMINPSQGAFRVQPEVADMQQRMRVAVDMLYKDLLMAGAGTYSGTAVGALTNFFAPIKPYRTGKNNADNTRSFRTDAISLLYVPQTAAQTTITDPMPTPSAEIKVKAQPGCPQNDLLCGFKTGQVVLIFDDSGASDTFQITNVQTNALHLQHRGTTLSKSYTANSYIAQADSHTYYLDATTNQLRHYDGWETDVPLVDNIVGLRFRYYGDPNPPLAPKPPFGTANCLFDATGKSTLPSLGAGSLVELTALMLTDGPWCGVVGNDFDADLYRVKKVRVELRVQVAAQDLRGADTTLFARPGQASSGQRLVPDYLVAFDVTPRNMNLQR